jgi:transposase InsO family protein
MWHINITYIPITDNHAYLISALDGCSCYIVHSKLSLTITTEDVKEVLSRALFKTNLFEVPDENNPMLVSDIDTQFVSNSFQDFFDDLGY